MIDDVSIRFRQQLYHYQVGNTRPSLDFSLITVSDILFLIEMRLHHYSDQIIRMGTSIDISDVRYFVTASVEFILWLV